MDFERSLLCIHSPRFFPLFLVLLVGDICEWLEGFASTVPSFFLKTYIRNDVSHRSSKNPYFLLASSLASSKLRFPTGGGLAKPSPCVVSESNFAPEREGEGQGRATVATEPRKVRRKRVERTDRLFWANVERIGGIWEGGSKHAAM